MPRDSTPPRHRRRRSSTSQSPAPRVGDRRKEGKDYELESTGRDSRRRSIRGRRRSGITSRSRSRQRESVSKYSHGHGRSKRSSNGTSRLVDKKRSARSGHNTTSDSDRYDDRASLKRPLSLSPSRSPSSPAPRSPSRKRRHRLDSRSVSPPQKRRDRSPNRSRNQKSRKRSSSVSPNPPRRIRLHSPSPPQPRKRSRSPPPRSRNPLPSQELSFRGERPGQDGTAPKSPLIEKEKPNFGNTGLLAKESNTVAAGRDATTGFSKKVVLKYNEPPEARKPPPSQPWRLYIFKGSETLKTIPLYTASSWLIGREASVADLFVEHPSCSKQHAVIQFRHSVKVNEFGDKQSRVKPYLLDLDSANGTKLNGEKIAGSRFVEVKDADVVNFGLSEREYVFQLPPAAT